jgi:hypothetical protein
MAASSYSYNPYQTSGLDAKVPAWDFRAQSALSGRKTQESVWNANQASAANASSAIDNAKAQSDANNAEILGMSRGRIDELRNDPVDAMVLQALQRRATGADAPYDETTRNALFTGQSEMAAASMQNQLSHLQGSPSDPSYQAQVAALQDQRQRSLQSARLNVDQKANLANYDARGQALGQTGAFNSGRNAAITDSQRYLSNYLQNQKFATADEIYGQSAAPSYSNFTIGAPAQAMPQYSAPVSGYYTGAASAGNGLAGRSKNYQASTTPGTLQSGSTFNWTTGQPYAAAPAKPVAKPQQFGGSYAKPIGPNFY